MGNCFGSSSDKDEDAPNPEERRRLQAEAAEKRLKGQEARGIKDPDALKRKQEQAEKYSKMADERAKEGPDGGLKWQVS